MLRLFSYKIFENFQNSWKTSRELFLLWQRALGKHSITYQYRRPCTSTKCKETVMLQLHIYLQIIPFHKSFTTSKCNCYWLVIRQNNCFIQSFVAVIINKYANFNHHLADGGHYLVDGGTENRNLNFESSTTSKKWKS